MLKKVALAILSQFYMLGVNIRHRLFDWGILKVEEFDIPVICVGNITVGGTGKTPMCEMLVEHMRQKGRVAILSRGYGRKSRGYIEVEAKDNYLRTGDEPLQMKRKYPTELVVVCEKRVKGIKRIIKDHPEVKSIIMDDGFQHRYVEPKMNIIMVDATRPIEEDYPLPLGTLRDSREMLYRANYFVVTKCPDKITPFDRSVIRRELVTMPYQKIFFTRIINQSPIATYPDDAEPFRDDKEMVVMSGIGNPTPFIERMQSSYNVVERLVFNDHHSYKKSDYDKIQKILNKHPEAIIITTEKDSTKFVMNDSVPKELRSRIYYSPITMKFIVDSKEELLKSLDYDIK